MLIPSRKKLHIFSQNYSFAMFLKIIMLMIKKYAILVVNLKRKRGTSQNEVFKIVFT